MSAPLPLFLNIALQSSSVSFTKFRQSTLTDELNTLPELVMEAFHDNVDLEMDELLGQPITLLFEETAVPQFEGIVRHVEQRALDIAGVSVYAITVVPRHWLLTQRSSHRIFQNKTVVEIAAELLAELEIEPPVAQILERELARPEYRVQWGETDYEFLFRLLSEEGLISFWCPDESGRREWTITDTTTVGKADLKVKYDPTSGALTSTEPHVSAAAVNARICTSGVKVRDYDYLNPRFKLEGRWTEGKTSASEDALVRYGFGVGRFEDEKDGEALAAMRLSEARAKARTFRWEANFALRPGMKVKLRNHPRDEANGTFLVVSAWSEMSPTTHKHMAEVIPASTQWRPAVRPKQRIHGTETAFVVGASGKEIDVDKEGRVEVEFRWDTRDLGRTGASRRVRVAMPWAGQSRGFWTLPRVGDEVVIAYLHGDPDQPLVVGSVYNAATPSFVPVPEFETRSGWVSRSVPGGQGYNYILMEDAAGGEILALRGQRDFTCETGRRSHTVVGENQIVEVGGNQVVSVGGSQNTGAGNVSITAGGEYKLTAKTLTLHSTADMAIGCGGTRIDSTEGFHTISAQTLTLAGRDCASLTGGQVRIVAADGGSIVLEVGASSIEMSPDKITIKSPLVEINP